MSGRGKSVEEIILETRKGKGTVAKILEQEKNEMADELEKSKLQTMLEEQRQKLRQLQQQNQPIPQGQAQNFAHMMFVGRKPEEIKEILDALGPEHMQKLAMISSAMTPNNFQDFRGFMQQPSITAKDIVEALKTGVEVAKVQNQSSGNMESMMKSMAEVFKAGVEVAKGQAPSQQNPLATLKEYHETFIAPLLSQLSQRDKDLTDLKIREVESRIVNPMEYIKQVKAMANDLGLSPAGKSEIDLKLAEMAQTERLENRRIDWEMAKHEDQKESDKQLYGLIGKVVEGPVAKVTESLGGAAADRLRGGKQQGGNQGLQVRCMACQDLFVVDPRLNLITCPNCGAQMAKQPSPQQQMIKEVPPSPIKEVEQSVAEPKPESTQEPQPQQ